MTPPPTDEAAEPGAQQADQGQAIEHEAVQVLANADCVLSEAQVYAAYDQLANDIQTVLSGTSPIILVCMVGGLIPAAGLLARMDMALEVDYLHATRYRGGLRGHEIQWRTMPSSALQARHVLLVDDILDEGYTLVETIHAVRARGAASVRSAVLVEKCHERRVPGLSAEFVGAQVPDRYVFGCGMDYKGWHRQLPAIYAVAEHGTADAESGDDQ
jgi:hypoxanthine phosphoribosyltransferase